MSIAKVHWFLIKLLCHKNPLNFVKPMTEKIKKFIILTPKRWYVLNVKKLGCLAFLLRKEMSWTLRLVIMYMHFVFFFFLNPKDKGYESTCYFSRECTVFLSKASQCAYYIWINAVMYGPLIITLISTSSGIGVLNISLSLSQNIVLNSGYFSQPLSLIIQVLSHIFS